VAPGLKLAAGSIDALQWNDGAGVPCDPVRRSEEIASTLGLLSPDGDGGEVGEQE
jgi:hypothetical protein